MAQGIEHAQFDLSGTGQGEGEAGAAGHGVGVEAEAGGEVGLVAGGGNYARRVGHGEVAGRSVVADGSHQRGSAGS